MPKFNALYLIEHDNRDVENTDNRIIILYDDYEDAFFYYGTRRRVKNETTLGHRYINHSGLCKAWDRDSLIHLLTLLLNSMDCFITSEMHVIELNDSEYENLDFDRVYRKLNEFNCLYAYDKMKETSDSLKKKIDAMYMTVNF